MMVDEKIAQLREEIDEINFELLKLLNKRLNVVELIGLQKERQGLKTHDPAREGQILAQLLEKNQGPMTDEMVIQLFQEIFKLSVEYQEKYKKE